MEVRINKLRAKFDELGVDAFLSNRLSNIQYLCGYSGSAGLLFVTRDKAYFLTDFRYKEQVARQVKGAESIIISKSFPDEFANNDLLKFKGKIGIEAVYMTVDLLTKMQESLPGCECINTDNIVEEVASVKDQDELDKIKKAVKITDDVFAEVLALVKPGIREIDIAAEITYRHMKHGASGNSFDSIIASGVNGSLPHAGASEKVVEKGDFITFDMGCMYQGYASDMTRTVVVGQPTDKQKEIYGIVYDAQQAALDAAKGGMSGMALDKIARDIIVKAGYGEYYGHGLGHGLGMEVHAHPRASHIVDHPLLAGQVITIEPGIYIPGWGGVRIEDDVILTETGNIDITGTTRDLIVVEW